MRTALVVFSTLTFALTGIASAAASDLDSAFWLQQYEHAEQAWNNVAVAYVLGALDGAGTFGGIRCPTLVSPRTLAAMTADVVKQGPKNQPAINAVVRAAIRVNCLVDMDLINRAIDVLEKEKNPRGPKGGAR